MKEYKYDVAISFAGEHRDYAKKLAEKLEQCGFKIFYDNWNIDKILGQNLYKYLHSIYFNGALYTVALFSEEYFDKRWPKIEFKNIMLRQYSEDEYLLPILMDDVEIPEEVSSLGFVNSKDLSIDEIVIKVTEKINKKAKINYDNKITENQKMTVLDENSNPEMVTVILAFEFKDDKKEYVVYTKNEKDNYGNTTVYVSNVDRSSGEPQLNGVEDEQEWERVKDVLKQLSADSDGNTPLNHPPFFDKDGIEIM